MSHVVGKGPLSLKSHKPPPLAEPYRILLKSLYFPANNSDIIIFLKFAFLTHLGQIICMDYHEKTLTKSDARFFAQVVSPDYLLVIFIILNA